MRFEVLGGGLVTKGAKEEKKEGVFHFWFSMWLGNVEFMARETLSPGPCVVLERGDVVGEADMAGGSGSKMPSSLG